MEYHLARDGQQLGCFTREQFTEGIANGTVRGTDLAWTEGMANWQPVAALFPPRVPDQPPPLTFAPPAPVAAPWPAALPAFTQAPRTEGYATAALVLGLLCFLLGCLTAIPAVVFGHGALGRIKRSNGMLTGKGMAVTGLVIGYLFLAIVPVVGIVAAIVLPAYDVTQEKALQAQSVNNVRQVLTGLKTYAAGHQGKYPATLDELAKAGIFENQKVLDSLLDYPRYQGWTWNWGSGYDYMGGTASDPGPKVILMSRSHAPNGARILGHNDGSAEIAVPGPTPSSR